MTGKFECPFCGEPVPIDSKRCPVCDFDLTEMTAKSRAQSVDKIRGVLVADLAELESSEEWK